MFFALVNSYYFVIICHGILIFDGLGGIVKEPNSFMILEGPHGCGKTTALECLEKHGWVTITMSNVLRDYVKTMKSSDPEVCKYIANCLNSRTYVNSETCNIVFSHYMSKYFPVGTTWNKKFVLDGYPRKRKQVDHLYHLLFWDRDGYHSERRVSSLFFEVYPWVAMARQWNRGLQINRPDDLDPELIIKAFDRYRKYSPEVRLRLLEHTKFYSIDANQSPAEGAKQIESVIKKEEARLQQVSQEMMLI